MLAIEGLELEYFPHLEGKAAEGQSGDGGESELVHLDCCVVLYCKILCLLQAMLSIFIPISNLANNRTMDLKGQLD